MARRTQKQEMEASEILSADLDKVIVIFSVLLQRWILLQRFFLILSHPLVRLTVIL